MSEALMKKIESLLQKYGLAYDDMSYQADRIRQTAIGLSMTPAERLRWLERTVEEFRPYVGAASRLESSSGEPR